MAVIALVGMINYLGARHLLRFTWSAQTGSSFPRKPSILLKSITNQVKVVVYYDKNAPLLPMSSTCRTNTTGQSQNYRASGWITSAMPAAAKIMKTYKLGSADDKNLVIFECDGRTLHHPRQPPGRSMLLRRSPQ